MKKILFICHGNICRSPMAEFVMKNLVRNAGMEEELIVDSAAVSCEEIGNGVYPPVLSLLRKKGIPVGEHRAHRITVSEFDDADLVVVMDKSNISRLSGIVGEERTYRSGKVHMMMEYAVDGSCYPDVADPWYTRDFEQAYQDIFAGCKGLIDLLIKQLV